MEQNQNIAPGCDGDEPETSPTSNHLVRTSDRLVPGHDEADGTRRDGWTPERKRAFLTTIAEGGTVSDAARAAGMSRQSCYALSNRADGRAFSLGWNAAKQKARNRLEDELMSRALHGQVELLVRDGEVVERHRIDNRLGLAMLERLDRKAAREGNWENRPAVYAADEFEQFLDIVCEGGERAAGFVAARHEVDEYVAAPEQVLLERSENYRRYKVGLPSEIDVSDLDLDRMESWTDEQEERGLRAGLIELRGNSDDDDDDDEEGEFDEEDGDGENG